MATDEGTTTGTDAGAGKTFSQADVDRIVRDRIAREREKYADYDEVKSKAADADKNATALDKLLAKVSDLEAGLKKSNQDALRAQVALDMKLSPRQAKRLQGGTREELEADARELLEDWGGTKDTSTGGAKDGGGQGDAAKTGEGQAGGDGGNAGAKDTSGKDGAGQAGGKDTGTSGSAGDAAGGSDGGRKALPPAGRPKETLTAGAVPAAGADKSPAELAEAILKSDL